MKAYAFDQLETLDKSCGRSRNYARHFWVVVPMNNAYCQFAAYTLAHSAEQVKERRDGDRERCTILVLVQVHHAHWARLCVAKKVRAQTDAHATMSVGKDDCVIHFAVAFYPRSIYQFRQQLVFVQIYPKWDF